MSPGPTEQPLALSSFSLRSWPSGRDDLQQAVALRSTSALWFALGLQLGSELELCTPRALRSPVAINAPERACFNPQWPNLGQPLNAERSQQNH
jgi:hypothetical protein